MPRWKEIPARPGYEVSDDGRVRSWVQPGRYAGRRKEPLELKPWADKHGRKAVVCGRTNSLPVAPLVLEAFVGPRPAGYVAMHADDNPANNELSNLKWGTSTENNAFKVNTPPGKAAKLDEAKVRGIRAASGSLREIGKQFGISPSQACWVRLRKAWAWVT